MTKVEQIAAFAGRTEFSMLSAQVRERIKHNILDTIGCAIGAVDGGTVQSVRKHVTEFRGPGTCTLIGLGESDPMTSTLYNGSLVRYLDFMDNYMGKNQSCHPCDTFAPVLAASELANRSGSEFMTSLALAYQVFCMLIDHFPTESIGFDHTLQLGIAAACGVAHALKLDHAITSNAIAIAASAVQGSVEVRSDYLSQWKGLASAFATTNAMRATLLAKEGITGPSLIIEGTKGFETLLGETMKIEWDEAAIDRIPRTSIKKYNAEIHSQSAIEGILELRDEQGLRASDVDSIDVEIFRQANNIIGEGEESGNKKNVHSKEQADHSLFYILAVALLDGEVTPKQYIPERIGRADVQQLLDRIDVGRKSNIGLLDTYTHRYPGEMPCKITVKLRSGKELTCEKKDYDGFFKRPMSWDKVVQKFDGLAAPYTSPVLRSQIVDSISNLENVTIRDVTKLLCEVQSREVDSTSSYTSASNAVSTDGNARDSKLGTQSSAAFH